MTNILVTYASKHNSTAEIARVIGHMLRDSEDVEVAILSVESVEDITPYDAVILGSAVYAGKWQPEAADFLKKHQHELAQRPTWLFSSGPTGKGDPQALTKGWELPESLRPIAAAIKPRDVVVFSGKLDPANLNTLLRMVVKAINSPAFHLGDFRDWNSIRAWANGISQSLKQTAHA